MIPATFIVLISAVVMVALYLEARGEVREQRRDIQKLKDQVKELREQVADLVLRKG